MRKIPKGLKSQMDSGQKRDKSRARAGHELCRRQREKKKIFPWVPCGAPNRDTDSDTGCFYVFMCFMYNFLAVLLKA